MIDLPNNNQLDIVSFSQIFHRQGLTNSYKLFFFKALFDSIQQGKLSVSFTSLSDFMFMEALPLIHVYKLTLGHQDLIEKKVKEFNLSSKYSSHQALQRINGMPSNEKTSIVTSYVMYRLLRPFYKTQSFSGNDQNINNQLLNLINRDKKSLYYIDLHHQTININPLWTEYIIQHSKLILEWYKFNLIVFLQTRNPSTPNIPFKVDSSLVSRSLAAQTKVWDFACMHNHSLAFDIYLNQEITPSSVITHGTLSLDHVIPFDFVMHNELWNLTPMHKNLNSEKSNHLPQLTHVERFVDLQYSFYKTVQTFHPFSSNKHPLQDYEYLNPLLHHSNYDVHFDDFSKILTNQIISLHTIAFNQGFNMWK